MTDRKPIEVTQELIDGAIVRDSSHCVIADALRAAVPAASRVSVDLQTIRFTDGKRGKRYTFLTPPTCQRTLLDFDQGKLIEPFAFRLGPPVHVATGKVRPKASGEPGTKRAYKPRRVRSNGRTGQVPTVLDGTPLPANGALATGGRGGGKAKIRQFGLRQLKA